MTHFIKNALLAGAAAIAFAAAPAYAELHDGGGAPEFPDVSALPEIGGGELPISIIVTPPTPDGDIGLSGGHFSLTGGELTVVVTPPSGGGLPELPAPPEGLPGLPELPAPPGGGDGGGLPDLADLTDMLPPPPEGLPGLPELPAPPGGGGGLPGLPELPAPPGGGGGLPGMLSASGELSGGFSITM